ncbi:MULTISPECIES: CoA transferase [Streptomyces]|uniref:Formyl-CoA transferase n=1 Tax=Streptomyces sviceus (strain ATCC 29083 / DSM 924 / JCM 4929 / NBRC 13980 / NCIMB 11184 / NRRL 5439 / UC 5370) TaxID=463191 RepID=B5HPE3_STRX2|nr:MULTISPECIES: CoA transferase [Streptomyces]EDY54719.1 formyl-CoA transferase [Streptomyces sviceus ATCC 29083]MYT10533.1 CoA transferase [Streptomyces sp. SID5470]
MPSTALAGIRVLDLSRILAAPLATQMLADLGAEVIKVERPGSGDDSRTYGPPFAPGPEGDRTDTAAFYLSCNRNKRSVTVNHASTEGQELIRALAARSDVVVENFRTGTLAKYGLDHESLRALNPRLVYLSVTGFGQTGPYADRPGYDGIFQAMSGMMSVSGHPEEPMKVGVSMIDILTGLYASTAVLAALRHRDRTGEGQFIDLSLLDCGLASLSHFAMNYLVSGEVPQRRGNGGYGGIPSQAFPCKDRPIFLVAGNDKQFAAFCAAADRTDLLQDERFATTPARIAHREEILPVLAAILRTRTRDEWLTVLDAHDVPAGPYNEMPEVFADPQIQHRGMLIEVEDPASGHLSMLANPIRFTATPVEGYAPPPALGEHTAEVLTALAGVTDSQLAALRDRGVV